jgi:hypothetical protein
VAGGRSGGEVRTEYSGAKKQADPNHIMTLSER